MDPTAPKFGVDRSVISALVYPSPILRLSQGLASSMCEIHHKQSCQALAIKMCVIHHKCNINSVEVCIKN